MVDVKFCGITRPADVRVASELGARYVGCIFAESPRRVTADRAREIADEARRDELASVGVFSTGDVEEILSLVDVVGLNAVQLHARLSGEDVARLRSRFEGEIWLVTRVGRDGLEPSVDSLFNIADGVVFDTLSERMLGGTGERFDWRSVAGSVAAMSNGRRARLIVAGGLRAENVGDAIATLSPDVVDVSSGVESAPGLKDPQRMRAFVEAVRTSTPR